LGSGIPTEDDGEVEMEYESYDQEWDGTWNEMHNTHPKLGDKVLCSTLKVEAGEIIELLTREKSDSKEQFYVVRLEDGSIDEYAREDVLVRKAA